MTPGDPEKNPYINLRKQEDAPEDPSSSGPSPNHQNNNQRNHIEDEDDSAARRKKRSIFILVSLIVLTGLIGLLYWKFGNIVTVNQQVNGKLKPKDATPGAGEQQPVVDAIIAQARRERSQAGEETIVPVNSPEPGPSAGSAPPAAGASGGEVTPNSPRLIIPDYSMQTPPNRPTTTGGSAGSGGSGNPSTRGGSGGGSGGRSRGQLKFSKSSVYVVEPPPAPAARVPVSVPVRSSVAGFPRPTAYLEPVRVPEFGALLHVRTLGTIHTLRSGSYARLELTHDMQGKGWSLKKGTIFVAQTQGTALDRALVGVTGFIDPKTNRMVKLNGDLLGGDGALGMKGKRRQFTSRWSRAFNRALNIAPGIAQAALSRGGRGTVIIAPVGGELIGSYNSIGDRREFVEVQAGMPGYILVTDLPDGVKSIDADPTEHLAGAEQTVANTDTENELSDDELAELFASGSVKEIKAAMPRMNPALRRIAALAINQKEKE